MHLGLPAKQTGTEIKCNDWACLFTPGGATASQCLGYVLRCAQSAVWHLMTGQTNKKWMGLRELVHLKIVFFPKSSHCYMVTMA